MRQGSSCDRGWGGGRSRFLDPQGHELTRISIDPGSLKAVEFHQDVFASGRVAVFDFDQVEGLITIWRHEVSSL